MTQLEGTENRIATARNRSIQAVQDYNVSVRRFPGTLIAYVLGFSAKPNFSVENEAAISTAPKVDFGTSPRPRSHETPLAPSMAAVLRRLALAGLAAVLGRCPGGGAAAGRGCRS